MSSNRLLNSTNKASATSERLLYLLKTRGPLQSAEAGEILGMTAEAARQQLTKLASAGLVETYSQSQGVGRPSQFWALTEAGHNRFPDTHSMLTVQLLDTVRQTFGEEAIDRLIDLREQTSRENYLRELKGEVNLRERVARLALLRSQEGYMADYEELADGTLLFIENHCPICAAAAACQGFCRAELKLFREVLGAKVERVEHVLNGARRCAYAIFQLPEH
ncbi:transcriptional regulator [Salmonella enterica]|mgnify:CR=1 FL=1|uniref:helix-turn-helix transcriptional regulator n=1 Tax=Enterobacterales TaxID=91347 RepID=UPI000CFAAEBE|nr:MULTISPECIES: metalloregulator ArsR/SmtB family transcription factor [Enterobacterales]EAQ6188091.1 transcriptional regulator [Salmonella enterica]EFJ4049632.1 transcriptional regulator [Escherichia coli]EKZ5446128.1 transcriptional regulator [Klebsiella aerogenes]ELY6226770.1 transcriptional regulator [Cronobacter muytjensii]ELY6247584.1 transcriptional regulator [Cronobacter universalis]HDH1768051.1 transcriptional regulator [Klebsiella quasipneumoniae subsp. similipneumoniae]